MTLDTKHFKDALEKELSNLETELSSVGRKNPNNPADWEATESDNITPDADEADVADSMEVYQNNRGILDQLEIRLNNVKNALAKIGSDKFGICEVCGEKVEEDRLEANPAAATCKLHMNG